MRLFVALDIDRRIRERIAEFVADLRGLAPAAHWVSPESLHVTLKFIGEQSSPRLEEFKRVLTNVHCALPSLSFRGTGFFPNPRSPRVFWVGIDADASLSSLAAQVDESLTRTGLPGEERAFSPHLTLARGGDLRHPRGGSGNPRVQSGDKQNLGFARLQEKVAQMSLPEFGTMTAPEFFLFESKLSSSGASYTKLARFPLTQG